MSLEERENYRPEDQYFQDDETRYEDEGIDAPPADHSVSDNAEPDYADDFSNENLNRDPDDEDFDDDLDDEDDEFEDDDLDEEDDLQDDNFDKESLEDEEYTDPNRQL